MYDTNRSKICDSFIIIILGLKLGSFYWWTAENWTWTKKKDRVKSRTWGCLGKEEKAVGYGVMKNYELKCYLLKKTVLVFS